MSNPYLVAHKVRGEPAFDVATQMPCPECLAAEWGCSECDGTGQWWIIPTSGHRAYPYWYTALGDHRFFYEDEGGSSIGEWYTDIAARMPPGLPDHYPHHSAPTISLAEALGITKPKAPSAPIIRRF